MYNVEHQLKNIMSHSEGTVLIRKATHEDYEAVMDINRDIYYGADYLGVWYHQILQEPSKVVYLMELDGKVVSLSKQ